MNWENIVLLFVTLLISLTVHEAAHAWVAMLGGDRTAYSTGQVTINPLPHIQREPFGMVALPILVLLMSNGTQIFGFAHAPYDPYWAQRHPRKAALMAAAGPMANFVLAAIAFAVLWFVGRPDSGTETAIRKIALTFLYLDLMLGVFNLVPLPPLDGASIVRGLVPATGRLFDAISRVPYATLLVFVLLSRYLGAIYEPLFYKVVSWLPYPF